MNEQQIAWLHDALHSLLQIWDTDDEEWNNSDEMKFLKQLHDDTDPDEHAKKWLIAGMNENEPAYRHMVIHGPIHVDDKKWYRKKEIKLEDWKID